MTIRGRAGRLAIALVGSAALASSTLAQKADDRPAVRSALPPGATPGKLSRLVLRGRKLDAATAVRLAPDLAPVTIVERGKSPTPKEIDANRVGDTRLVVEFELPAGSARDPIAIEVDTPDGRVELFPLAVDHVPPTPEREPNGGFREAQPIAPGSAVDGTVEASQDVDAFRFEAKEGDRVRVAVAASRRGSALDPVLSLYDARGNLVATADDPTQDAGTNRDPTLEVALPATGRYYAVVADAHDKGGPLYTYRLSLAITPAGP